MGWFLGGIRDGYDRANPDFEFLERIARSATPLRGDFSQLNGGDWAVLCVVGAGADLAALPARLRSAFGKNEEPAGPTEFTLVYAARDGTAKRLRHPHGYAFAREGALKCTPRDQPVLTLPAGLRRGG